MSSSDYLMFGHYQHDDNSWCCTSEASSGVPVFSSKQQRTVCVCGDTGRAVPTYDGVRQHVTATAPFQTNADTQDVCSVTMLLSQCVQLLVLST